MAGGGKAPPPPDYTPLAEANKYAARLQKEAADNAMAEWKRQYQQTRDDLAPWRESGQWAVGELQAGIESGKYDPETYEFKEWEGFGADDFEKDPGYQFRMNEGMEQLQRQMASQYGANSGATLKALQRHGQNVASQEFSMARNRAIQDYQMQQQNYVQGLNSRNAATASQYNQMAGLAGTGQQSTHFGAQMGNQQTSGIANTGMQGAAAQAAGHIGAANAMVQNDVARYNQQVYQNQLDQQGFNNMLSVVGAGMNIASGGAAMGWWGG